MSYTVTPNALLEVLILQPKGFDEVRGFFFENFNQRDFQQATGLNVDFVQDNHSKSSQGVLSGLHYQIQHPQGKLGFGWTGIQHLSGMEKSAAFC